MKSTPGLMLTGGLETWESHDVLEGLNTHVLIGRVRFRSFNIIGTYQAFFRGRHLPAVGQRALGPTPQMNGTNSQHKITKNRKEAAHGCGSQMQDLGFSRCWSLLPFNTKVPFWVFQLFEPQPYQNALPLFF